MISKKDKNADRIIRHARVRKKVGGTAERPRLCVYRSTNHIYAQIIDDVKGHTLALQALSKKTSQRKLQTFPRAKRQKSWVRQLLKRLKISASKKSCSTEAAIFTPAECKHSPTAQEKPVLSFNRRNYGRKS